VSGRRARTPGSEAANRLFAEIARAQQIGDRLAVTAPRDQIFERDQAVCRKTGIIANSPGSAARVQPSTSSEQFRIQTELEIGNRLNSC
jgi:hypothetical protein